MRNALVLFLSFFFLIVLEGQDQISMKYADLLDTVRMKKTIETLSSVNHQGRKSDGEGIQKSAEFLEKEFTSYKIKQGNNGSYIQNIEAYTNEKSSKYFTIDGFNFSDCYTYANKPYQDSVIFGDSIVFAGYGVYHASYSDFGNLDLHNKIVMVMDGDGPRNKYGVRCHESNQVPDLKYIASQNPKAILIVKEGFNTFYNYNSDHLLFYSPEKERSYPTVTVNELLANRILAPTGKTIKQLKYETEKECLPVSFQFAIKMKFNGDKFYTRSQAGNIVSVVEGNSLKDEYILVSAHYDHIGLNYRNEVYPGADDNASGVASVMEIARVMNEAKKKGKGPERTIVFLFPTAEEDGLKGSEYYIDNPLFPLEKTIACLNLDMIGRTSEKVESDSAKSAYLYAITGTRNMNDSLFAVPDNINKAYSHLDLFSTEGSGSYNDLYRRSDHYNFYQNKIPSILFTSGIHEDLHKSSDTPDKVDYKAMHLRARLIFLTLWEFANRPDPYNL